MLSEVSWQHSTKEESLFLEMSSAAGNMLNLNKELASQEVHVQFQTTTALQLSGATVSNKGIGGA